MHNDKIMTRFYMKTIRTYIFKDKEPKMRCFKPRWCPLQRKGIGEKCSLHKAQEG